MSKTLIFQIPLDKNNNPTVDYHVFSTMLKEVQESLPSDYKCMASIASNVSCDEDLMLDDIGVIKLKEYHINDLISMLSN